MVAADQLADELHCIKVQESFAHLACVLIATRVYCKWFLIVIYCDSGKCCGPAGRSQNVTVATVALFTSRSVCSKVMSLKL